MIPPARRPTPARRRSETLVTYHRLIRYRPKGWREKAKALRVILEQQGHVFEPLPDDPPPPLRPLGDHVLIAPDAARDTTDGGLHIPESAKEVPERGIVLAVGPGRIEPGVGTVVPAVTVGDHVLFGRYASLRVTLADRPLLIVREEDILGILNGA